MANSFQGMLRSTARSPAPEEGEREEDSLKACLGCQTVSNQVLENSLLHPNPRRNPAPPMHSNWQLLLGTRHGEHLSTPHWCFHLALFPPAEPIQKTLLLLFFPSLPGKGSLSAIQPLASTSNDTAAYLSMCLSPCTWESEWQEKPKLGKQQRTLEGRGAKSTNTS